MSKGQEMVGVVIVTHCNLAEELLRATRLVVGDESLMEAVEAISMEPDELNEELIKKINAAIKRVNKGEGVLLLTDMFGGTPSNVSLSFLKEKEVEVVTGVNLPMLVALGNYRKGKTLEDLARFVADYGRKQIHLANEILKKGPS
jgi:PTS system mannose-specific IIA component